MLSSLAKAMVGRSPRSAMRPKLMAAACLAAFGLLGGCSGGPFEVFYYSPNGKVALGLQVEKKGGFGPAKVIHARLYGEVRENPQTLGYDTTTVELGTYVHISDSPVRWTDATTVNICELRDDPKAKRTVNISGFDGVLRTYHLTTDCPGGRPGLMAQQLSEPNRNIVP